MRQRIIRTGTLIVVLVVALLFASTGTALASARGAAAGPPPGYEHSSGRLTHTSTGGSGAGPLQDYGGYDLYTTADYQGFHILSNAYCTPPINELTIQHYGEHCDFYLFGQCRHWNTTAYIGDFCGIAGSGTASLWCPGSGEDIWNVPDGWLVRARGHWCAYWPDGSVSCEDVYSSQYQF